ncbi:MAG: tyrosine-type recombinase/integrase [Planctomycetes bacterium]|nr:tyrosine-type recombinase/integrase [Planctomycetota bacterium]
MNVTFSYLVTRFFISHLANERNLAENTIASYSDCMRLLIDYACTCLEVTADQLRMEAFTRDLILDFLDSLEADRSNSADTRNQRLTAIKTFFQFLARTVPELMHLNECIQAIRPKNTDHKPPPSLTHVEVDAIIADTEPDTLLGARDRALLQTAYNTGARVQEIADLEVTDLRFDVPATVTLTGKGRKCRTIPLWPETVELIQHYLQLREQAGIQSEHLFLNNRGKPITRFGIGRRVTLHTQRASRSCPSLCGRSVTPHVFRHTTALHLLEATGDITVVRDWLGHADLRTTSQYIEVSVERKRQALEKLPAPTGSTEAQPAKWETPPLLDFLTKLSRKAHYVA